MPRGRFRTTKAIVRDFHPKRVPCADPSVLGQLMVDAAIPSSPDASTCTIEAYRHPESPGERLARGQATAVNRLRFGNRAETNAGSTQKCPCTDDPVDLLEISGPSDGRLPAEPRSLPLRDSLLGPIQLRIADADRRSTNRFRRPAEYLTRSVIRPSLDSFPETCSVVQSPVLHMWRRVVRVTT